jgi:nitrous oxidase accessory protein NosD
LIKDLGYYGSGGFANWGGGILIYNNQYTRITNNVLQNVRLGIQTGNFSRANIGDDDFQYIGENTINTRRRGIFYNLHYGPASPFTLNANVITGVENTNETKWSGILIASQANAPSNITGNMINGSALVTPATSGIEVWNVSSTAYSNISGGTISNVDIGVFANNFEGYNGNGTDGAHATVSGVTITPKATGVG